jgi:hypothetical protein
VAVLVQQWNLLFRTYGWDIAEQSHSANSMFITINNNDEMDVDNNRYKSSKGRIWLAQINVNATA